MAIKVGLAVGKRKLNETTKDARIVEIEFRRSQEHKHIKIALYYKEYCAKSVLKSVPSER
jgi:hypothetical protein